MISKHFKFLTLGLVLFIFGCKTQSKVYDGGNIMEDVTLDTVIVEAPKVDKEIPNTLPKYNASVTRTYDITNTDLDLKFDWNKELVIGKAKIDFQPIFYTIDEISLDAQNFIIHSVKNNRGQALRYKYDDKDLVIALGESLKKGQASSVVIEYTAQPSIKSEGGSKAITSDKGLFFINPKNEDKNKPRQIWTQGETEHNSRWFPTFDRPNERMTHTITVTVEKDHDVLSNGKKISERPAANGMKTVTWRMDKPHAPYLTMLAIGDFAIVKDQAGNIPLEYWVDHGYEGDAKEIFNHTPEMIKFFSNKLNVKYPWNKYSQVVVHDYVSGAMENTTASIFGEFVQKHKLELQDDKNDYIVAHELFHQWFGDLVTCESWSNLTLQEGFANYSEYLWMEHKYGKDEAEAHRAKEFEGYLGMSEMSGTHPLIHYGYANKEEMFDAHSYNKGGMVLHMLRTILGDDAFFASLNKYLEDNKFTAVEVDELRMAFEDTTGQDLNWFFDQWYNDAGHPILEVVNQYDAATKTLTVKYKQTQTRPNHREIFVLPVKVALYQTNGKIDYVDGKIDKRKGEMVFKNVPKPAAVDIDGQAYLLAEINQNWTEAEYKHLLQYSPEFLRKQEATENLSAEDLQSFGSLLLKEKHPFFQQKALKTIDPVKNKATILDLAKNATNGDVRGTALMMLSKMDPTSALPIAEQIIKNQAGKTPMMSAFALLQNANPTKALDFAKGFLKNDPKTYLPIVSNVLARSGDISFLKDFDQVLPTLTGTNLLDVMQAYGNLIGKDSVENNLKRAANFGTQGVEHSDPYQRFFSANMLYALKQAYTGNGNTEVSTKIGALLKNVVANEKEEQLKQIYKNFK